MNERDLMAGVVDAVEKLLATKLVGEDVDARRALAILRQRMAMLRGWQEQSNEADQPWRHVRVKACERCQAPMFFARYDPPDGPWIPFELDAMNCEGVIPSWRWTVIFSGAVPVAIPCPDMTEGQIWVDHRQTCGAGEGPKVQCAPFHRRFLVNAAKLNAEAENESIRLTDRLLALQRRLSGDDKEA